MVQQTMLVPATSAAILLVILLLDRLAVEEELLPLLLPLLAANATHQVQEFLRRYFFTTGHSAAALGADAIRYLGQTLAIALFVITPGFDSCLGPLADRRDALWRRSVPELVASGISAGTPPSSAT